MDEPRAYLGREAPRAPLAVGRGLSLCGYSPDRKGRHAFDEWVRGCSNDTSADLAYFNLAATQCEARRQLGSAVLVGTPTVRAVGRRVPVLVPPGATAGPAPVGPELVLDAVQSIVGTDPVRSASSGVVAVMREAAQTKLEYSVPRAPRGGWCLGRAGSGR